MGCGADRRAAAPIGCSGAIVYALTLRRVPARRLDRSLANVLRKFASVAWLLLDSPVAATRLLKLCWRAEIAELEEPAVADVPFALEVEGLEVEAVDVEAVDVEAVDVEAVDVEAPELEPLETDALSCWTRLDSPAPPW